MHSQSGHRFHDQTSDRLGKGMKMTRKANGQGHTYKVGNSYRTAIRKGDHVVTATGSTAQESRKRAKAKLESLPNLAGRSNWLPKSKLQLRHKLGPARQLVKPAFEAVKATCLSRQHPQR